MSDYSFLQSIEGGWKQLKKWTLQKVTGAPEDSVEGGVWYNETSKRIEVDIGSENKEVAYVGEYAEHNSLLDKDGGDTINNYYGHVKQIHNNILDNFGKASGAIVSDSNNFIPIEQIPVGLLGGLTPKGAWNPSTNTPSLSNPPLATTRGWFYIASTSGTALGTDWASGDWCISDGTVWQKIDNTDKVSSVFGRTGSVVAASGDYNLDQINNGTTYKRVTSTEKNNYYAAYTHSQSAHAPANADNTQAAIVAAAAKTTPVDADVLPLLDSAASWAVKKLSWANIKAALKSYLDTLYSAIGHTHERLYKVVAEGKNIDETPILENQFTAYMVLNPTGTLPVTPLEVAYITEQTYSAANVIFQTLSTADSDRRFWRRRSWSGWLPWVEISTSIHASRHSAGGADPVSIDLSQIANMSAFMRLVNDDATAADARATLGAAAASHTHTTAQVTGLDTALAGKLSTSAGSVHAEGTYRSTAPSLAVGDAQYGLSAQSGCLNLFAQAGVAKLYSKSGGTDATFVGDLATQQWTNTQLGGKSDQFSSGGKYYGAENVAFWRGIVMLNFATHWNGGGAHVRVIDRHGTYDVYLRGEGGETTAAVDRFHVMHSSLTPPIFKARIDGQKVYLYKQDSGAFIDTSILGAETNGRVSASPFDYSSTTDPGGFTQYGSCSYESLKWVNGLTGDAQAQIDGKAANGHAHASITTNAGGEGKPVYFAGGVPVQCGYTNLFNQDGSNWAFNLYRPGEKTGRNIDEPLVMGWGYTAYVVSAPTGTLPVSASWAYITEQAHVDTGYLLQTFTGYWDNRSFYRRRVNGSWGAWSENANTTHIEAARTHWLKDNAGVFTGAELTAACDDAGYRGISMFAGNSGNMRQTLMVRTDTGVHEGGLYCDTDQKWMIFRGTNGALSTGYSPAAAANGGQIATTKWVKDVALQLGSGFSAGASVVVRAYSSGNNYAANTIYLEY